ncbi:hypothetical protein B0O99DRAFT_589828 [Bisporella sp. PMI_857]|nr:hypothetical protein B0O99DRAFT_589828 [Bisporella sp. PMI_857]
MSNIRPFTGSEEDVSLISENWDKIFTTWPIQRDRLARILRHRTGSHVIHLFGFCILYVEDGKGRLACVGVLPEERRKGIGRLLVEEAQKLASSKLVTGSQVIYEVNSVFPRFWPGVPKEFTGAIEFFSHLGFSVSKDPTARDLYRDISTEVANPELLDRVSKLPLTFSPWSPNLYEECMAKQRANFHNNQPWIDCYEAIAARNLHHEVMVTFNAAGEQVGWTLMCSPSSILCDNFAFLPLCPASDKTGLIACVGIDKDARGQGIGQAMLVAAMKNMKASL